MGLGSQSRFAASMGHESGGARQPDFFLKPVAPSAARLAPRLHWAYGRMRSLCSLLHSGAGTVDALFTAALLAIAFFTAAFFGAAFLAAGREVALPNLARQAVS